MAAIGVDNQSMYTARVIAYAAAAAGVRDDGFWRSLVAGASGVTKRGVGGVDGGFPGSDGEVPVHRAAERGFCVAGGDVASGSQVRELQAYQLSDGELADCFGRFASEARAERAFGEDKKGGGVFVGDAGLGFRENNEREHGIYGLEASKSFGEKVADSVKTGDSVGVERGKNYLRNKASRDARRKREAIRLQSNWRSPASAESSESSSGGTGKCWTVKEESVMEKRIREALEKKRAVEAELAARKAELALGRMNDKTLTELYDSRVKQEGIARMNQATERSEKSLERLRSVSPGSSATPGEIREALLFSETWKLKEKKIRAWIAAGRPEGGDLAILDEGKSTEVESLDTEDRAILAEYGTGSEADDDRYVEPSQAMKDETARVIRLSHKRHVEYVIRRLRGTGRDPASNLIGAELEYYQAMTAEEIANVV